MDPDELYENKGLLIFMGSTILIVVLMALVIFLPLSPALEQGLTWASIIIFSGSFLFLIIDLIKGSWDLPDIPREDWILYMGIFVVILLIFLVLAFKPSNLNIFSYIITE